MKLCCDPTVTNNLLLAPPQNNRPDVQSMLVQAMSDWYMSGDTTDHTRMARILDVAQEVKALPPMLDVNQFPFVIDLACWAAKREFLKLDKWVIDKLKEYQVRNEELILAIVLQLFSIAVDIVIKHV